MFRRDVSKSRDLVNLLHCLALADGDKTKAAEMARQQIPWFKKDVGGTGHDDIAGDFASTAGAQFMTLMEDGGSAFDVFRQAGKRAQFNSPLAIGEEPMIAEVVGEGVSFPLAKYSAGTAPLNPLKVAGGVVFSKEAWKTAEAVEAAVTELRQAAGLAVDGKVFADIKADAGTVQAASGDPMADLLICLNAVNLLGGGQLFFCVAPAQANYLATARAAEGGPLLYPDMSPTGGQLAGVQVLVSGALDGEAALVDATACVSSPDDVVELKTSEAGMIEMSGSPGMNSSTPAGPGESGEPPAPNPVVSMFQVDAMALAAIRTFGFKLLRASGAAVLTSVAWGQ